MKDRAIEAILDEGRRTRKPLPRGLWVVSIAIAVVCIAALAIGLVESWNVKPRRQADHSSRKMP